MRNGLIVALLVLATGVVNPKDVYGQSTTVSATITDTDGFAWSGGSYSISFNGTVGQYQWSGGNLAQNSRFTGALNSSGQFSVSIPSSTAITPSGSTWSITVCPNATSGCYTNPSISVSGSSQSLTSQLAPPGPRFPDYGTAYGYGTVEVSPTPFPGVSFLITGSSPSQQVWNGSSWIAAGAGITLTTTGNSGAATYSGGTLNIPQYQGAITLTTNYTSGFASLSGNTINVPHYQGALTLTTTGTSGAATLSGDTLNIPQYAGTTITDLGTLTYNAGGTTTFAAASAGIAAAKVTVTHSTATTFVPTGLVKWGSYQVEIIQDSTGGGVTFTLGSTGTCSVWKITGGGAGAITLSSSANAIDMLSFTFDGTNCIGSLSANAN